MSQSCQKRKIVLAITAGLAGVLLTATVGAQQPSQRQASAAVERYLVNSSGPLYDGYVEGQITPGNHRTLGDVRLFAPLWQTDNELLFADLRGQTDDRQTYEGNWGLGYRMLRDDAWILGTYGYYDSRWTQHGHRFDQMTLGIEAMSVVWEARVNGYLPDNDAREIAGAGGGPAYAQQVGNQLFVVTPPNVINEFAMWGLDAEVGALWDAWGPNNEIELRAYAGGYHFDSDKAAQSVSGPRFRLELRAYDLAILGEGSRLTFGADYQWDQVRNDQYFLSANVRIPFGPGSRPRTLIQRRMLDRVVRDVDVVTGNGDDGTGSIEQAVSARTGEVIAEVVNVESGDAASQINNAPANALIVVNGTFNSSGNLQLKYGQTMVGGGTTVPLKGAVTGAPVNYVAPGQAGQLGQANVTLADNAMLEQLFMPSATITGVNAQHVTLKSLELTDSSQIKLNGGSYSLNAINMVYSPFATTATDPTPITINTSHGPTDVTITNTTLASLNAVAMDIQLGGQAANFYFDGLMFLTEGSGSASLQMNGSPTGTVNFTMLNSAFSTQGNAADLNTVAFAGDFNLWLSGNTVPSGGFFNVTTTQPLFIPQASTGDLISENNGAVIINSLPPTVNAPKPALPTWP